MKQCPACKTTYTDETLRFCLADGAALQIVSDAEETTLISPNKKSPPNFTNDVQFPNQTKKRNLIPYIAVGLIAVLVLAFVGIAAVALLAFYGNNEKTAISNVSADTNAQNNSKSVEIPMNSLPANNYPINNTDEIKKKLADLQKKLEEQKNQQTKPDSSPFPNTTPGNYSAPTGRVAQTNDGFLSLRTEPSVKTGTQLIKIPSGATVELENCEKNQTTIDGRRGRWCLVTYAGETGWAFDAWLIY